MNSIRIKAANHRIYQCPDEKKIELLNKIVEEEGETDIIVVTSKDAQGIKEALTQEVRVIEDKDFVQDASISCDFLISYDMPIKDIVYIARVSKARKKAVMLLDESEQKELYAIEMLLGRAIKQEKIAGFEYAQKPQKEQPFRKKLSQDEIKEIAKKRYEKSTQQRESFEERKTAPRAKKEFSKAKPKKDDKRYKNAKVFKVKAKKISQ